MNVLARLLAERNLTQGQLSRMTGITRETICKVVNDRQKIGYPAHIAAIAWALEIDPYDLDALYDGRSPIPVGPNSQLVPADQAVSLPGEPLARAVRRYLDDHAPLGQKGRMRLDEGLPDPFMLRRRNVRLKRAEQVCSKLGIHPAEVYGLAYYAAAASS